ncbi:basic proline-rich protein-like [Cavia porcellus]|uniref:basic proline-rich protein-like n=2 Tax=Cavia porcellus TaxID=10141 RepID=UPI002FE10802
MVPWTLCSMSGRTFVTTHLRATRDGSRAGSLRPKAASASGLGCHNTAFPAPQVREVLTRWSPRRLRPPSTPPPSLDACSGQSSGRCSVPQCTSEGVPEASSDPGPGPVANSSSRGSSPAKDMDNAKGHAHAGKSAASWCSAPLAPLELISAHKWGSVVTMLDAWLATQEGPVSMAVKGPPAHPGPPFLGGPMPSHVDYGSPPPPLLCRSFGPRPMSPRPPQPFVARMGPPLGLRDYAPGMLPGRHDLPLHPREFLPGPDYQPPSAGLPDYPPPPARPHDYPPPPAGVPGKPTTKCRASGPWMAALCEPKLRMLLRPKAASASGLGCHNTAFPAPQVREVLTRWSPRRLRPPSTPPPSLDACSGQSSGRCSVPQCTSEGVPEASSDPGPGPVANSSSRGSSPAKDMDNAKGHAHAGKSAASWCSAPLAPLELISAHKWGSVVTMLDAWLATQEGPVSMAVKGPPAHPGPPFLGGPMPSHVDYGSPPPPLLCRSFGPRPMSPRPPQPFVARMGPPLGLRDYAPGMLPGRHDLPLHPREFLPGPDYQPPSAGLPDYPPPPARPHDYPPPPAGVPGKPTTKCRASGPWMAALCEPKLRMLLRPKAASASGLGCHNTAFPAPQVREVLTRWSPRRLRPPSTPPPSLDACSGQSSGRCSVPQCTSEGVPEASSDPGPGPVANSSSRGSSPAKDMDNAKGHAHAGKSAASWCSAPLAPLELISAHKWGSVVTMLDAWLATQEGPVSMAVKGPPAHPGPPFLGGPMPSHVDYGSPPPPLLCRSFGPRPMSPRPPQPFVARMGPPLGLRDYAPGMLPGRHDLPLHPREFLPGPDYQPPSAGLPDYPPPPARPHDYPPPPAGVPGKPTTKCRASGPWMAALCEPKLRMLLRPKAASASGLGCHNTAFPAPQVREVLTRWSPRRLRPPSTPPPSLDACSGQSSGRCSVPQCTSEGVPEASSDPGPGPVANSSSRGSSPAKDMDNAKVSMAVKGPPAHPGPPFLGGPMPSHVDYGSPPPPLLCRSFGPRPMSPRPPQPFVARMGPPLGLRDYAPGMLPGRHDLPLHPREFLPGPVPFRPPGPLGARAYFISDLRMPPAGLQDYRPPPAGPQDNPPMPAGPQDNPPPPAGRQAYPPPRAGHQHYPPPPARPQDYQPPSAGLQDYPPPPARPHDYPPPPAGVPGKPTTKCRASGPWMAALCEPKLRML